MHRMVGLKIEKQRKLKERRKAGMLEVVGLFQGAEREAAHLNLWQCKRNTYTVYGTYVYVCALVSSILVKKIDMKGRMKPKLNQHLQKTYPSHNRHKMRGKTLDTQP